MLRIIAAIALATALQAPALAQEAEAPVAQDQQERADDARAVLVRAFWPGQDLSNTFYRIFADETLRELVDIFRAGGPDGTSLVVLRPGTYWIMAVVDVNANGIPDAGDGLGFYGVNEISEAARPAPLNLQDDQIDSITIPILVRLNEQMRMEPLPWTRGAERGAVVGSIEGSGGAAGIVALLPVEEDAEAFATLIEGDGAFSFEVPAGSYVLIAAIDADGDGRLSAADPAGSAGSADEPIVVRANDATELDPISLSAGGDPDGIPPLVAGRITGVEAPPGARINVAFCADAAMREQAAAVTAGPDGRFAAALEPGTYYLRATIDRAGDDVLGPGDMLGFYGVADLMSEQTPAPLQVPEDALLTGVEIPISAVMTDDGRLSPWRGDDRPQQDTPANETGDEPGE